MRPTHMVIVDHVTAIFDRFMDEDPDGLPMEIVSLFEWETTAELDAIEGFTPPWYDPAEKLSDHVRRRALERWKGRSEADMAWSDASMAAGAALMAPFAGSTNETGAQHLVDLETAIQNPASPITANRTPIPSQYAAFCDIG